MSVMRLLGSASTVVDMSAWQSVIDALTAQVSVTTVVGVLAGLMGLGIGGVFMWWGLRKGLRFLQNTTFRGKAKM